MKTIVQIQSAKQDKPGTSPRTPEQTRTVSAAVSATTGAAVWTGLAVLARLGIARLGAIELLFLLAPLVIVPLGMELGRMLERSGPFDRLARHSQPPGAVLAVVAMCLPPGKYAGLAALGWMLVCALMAAGGTVVLARMISPRQGNGERAEFAPRIAQAAVAVARIDLAVGGAWLVASRLGLRPMGIQEPIALLTAVHFHYAGFATATIAAATLKFSGRLAAPRWLCGLTLAVISLPFAVAAGFVISPALKMVAALLFSVSVAGLAVFVRSGGRRAEDSTARALLQIASVSVFAGMVLAAAYAVADFAHSDALPIPQMARTHGLLNSMGFCLLGLLGWLVENTAPAAVTKE
jgi:hypothetical protein